MAAVAPYVLDPTVAEVVAAWWAADRVVLRVGVKFQRVIFEGDSLIVVNAYTSVLVKQLTQLLIIKLAKFALSQLANYQVNLGEEH